MLQDTGSHDELLEASLARVLLPLFTVAGRLSSRLAPPFSLRVLGASLCRTRQMLYSEKATWLLWQYKPRTLARRPVDWFWDSAWFLRLRVSWAGAKPPLKRQPLRALCRCRYDGHTWAPLPPKVGITWAGDAAHHERGIPVVEACLLGTTRGTWSTAGGLPLSNFLPNVPKPRTGRRACAMCDV